jgi:hypothetical protein
MAIEKPKPGLIAELIDIETTIKEAGAAYERAKNNQVFIDRKKQEQAIVDFKLQLDQSSIKLTNEQRKKLEKDFVRDYQAVRMSEERKFLRERLNQEKKNQIEFYKEQSKQSENQRKLEDQQLQKQLEIAKLRSKAILDEKGNVVGQKDAGKQLLDNLRADLKGLGSSIFKSLIGIGEKLSGEVNSVISTFAQYQSSINTRLQGTDSTFQSVQRNLTSNLGTSPFVKTSSLLESLSDLVSQGIAFNLDQRAFLDSLSDKIATTFDVANASLLRIVKLQQEDSTASRLGLEAGLTRYFNEMFQDTSYLSQTFDSVTDALVEATSQMGTKQSVEFEYIVQKWLGSLSAVGTSENTVRTLAEAIGFLGAGNVTALNASSMQNLLVMAASRAGLDYSSMLTEGLNAYNTNSLLQAVVGYMQEIGQGSNQVVKSQFAQTFGLSISDLAAASNIATDLDSITANMMSYSGTIDELGFQLNEISGRVSIAEKIQNVMSNIKFSIGQGIAENAVMAGMWSLTDLIQNVTGGIAIPAVSVFGNMVDLNTTVENLIKTGLVGISTLSKLPDLFRGLGTANNFSQLMGSYGIGYDPTRTDLMERARVTGTGLRQRARGLGVSETSIIGTGDAEGIAAFEVMKARAPSEAKQKESQSEQKTSNDIFNYLVYLLDPKLSTMTQMLGSMAGFNVGLTSFDNKMDKQSDYILNYGTTVRVSEPADSKSSRNYEKLEALSADVSGIHTLLKNGITVNIGSMGSNVSLTNASASGGNLN